MQSAGEPAPDVRFSYDKLDADEQAVLRASWAVTIEARRRALDLRSEFRATGRSWVEADDDGTVVHRSAHSDD